MKQNEMIQLLQKAGDKLKNQKLERMQQDNSENSLFTQQFLQQQILKSNCKNNQHLLTQNELEQAMKKFHNFLSQKKTYDQSNSLKSKKENKHAHTLSLNLQNIDTSSSEHHYKHTDWSSQSQHSQINEIKTNHIRQKSEVEQSEEIVDKLYDSLITKNIGILKPSTPKVKEFQFPIIEDPINEDSEISQFDYEQCQCQYYFVMVKKSFEQYNPTDYFQKIYRNHFRQLIQELTIGVKLKPHNYAHLEQKQMNLKQKSRYKNSITIIFDLDETLIHCNERQEKECDVILNVNYSKIQQVVAKINIRPYTFEILKKLSENFELMVFTASNKIYAQEVVQYLDPDNKLFSHVLYRESCILTTGGVYIKDLRVINRDLSKVVIIDNSPCNFAWNIENGIPIIPFFDNKNDQELYNLYNYLINLKNCKDVREYNKNNLQLHKYIGFKHKNFQTAHTRR